MKMTRRAMVLGSAAMALGARRALAGDSLDDLLTRIARARAGLRTLQGPFTQTRTIGLLTTDVRSTGTLALVRPDRLRWDLAPPDDITFWMGPEGLAYRSAHGEARVPTSSARVAASLEDMRTLLGGDLSRLRTRWDLRLVRDDASGAEVEGSPHADAAVPLRGIRFVLAPDLVRPVRTVLVEGPKDRTSIEFGAIVVDAPIDPARMRPPG
jgi:Outer membrane lipoprotein carrier protein LolA